jgi:hypothetical protein
MSIKTMKRIALVCALAASAAGLSGCGGTDYTPPPADVPAPPVTPVPPPVAQSFIEFVMAKVSTMLDTEEPTDIAAITATTPDDTEPVAVTM